MSLNVKNITFIIYTSITKLKFTQRLTFTYNSDFNNKEK